MGYADFDLTGKVALVTGGNSGIGLGLAIAVAQAGANVAIWGVGVNLLSAASGHHTGDTFVIDGGYCLL